MPTYRVQSSEGKNAAYHITIPLEYRTALGIQKGDRLECWRDGDTIVYRKVRVNAAKDWHVDKSPDDSVPSDAEIETLRDKANAGDPVACLYLGKLGREQGSTGKEPSAPTVQDGAPAANTVVVPKKSVYDVFHEKFNPVEEPEKELPKEGVPK